RDPRRRGQFLQRRAQIAILIKIADDAPPNVLLGPVEGGKGQLPHEVIFQRGSFRHRLIKRGQFVTPLARRLKVAPPAIVIEILLPRPRYLLPAGLLAAGSSRRVLLLLARAHAQTRSEERRVGKECRSQLSAYR